MSLAVTVAVTGTLAIGSSNSWANALEPNQIVGQLPIAPAVTLFSSPKFLLALVVGVVMAFAFQLLFTNLAIAVVTGPDSPSRDSGSESFGDNVRAIETKVGFGLLISVSIALFVASFLAVKLSLVVSPILGAIIGITIWSVFFTLLTWLGSTAMGSLLGSMINTATTGVQSLVGTGTAMLGANSAKNQMVSTAEDITAAVRRELSVGFDPDSIETVKDSLDKIQSSGLNLEELGNQFEKLFKDADLEAIADSDLLKNFDRESFVKLVSTRTDLSKKDINRITDQLESAWKKVIDSHGKSDPQELIKQLKSAAPEDLQSGKLREQLNKLIKKTSTQLTPGEDLTSRALQFGSTALLSRALQNVDLSDVDVEKIGGQLKTFVNNSLDINHESNGHQNGKSAQEPKNFSVIQGDLENYLLFSPRWKLNRETVKQEFRDVIYDKQADPGIIRKELELIDHDYFVHELSLRDDFNSKGSQDLASYLEDIRNEVFSTVQTAENQEKLQNFRSRVDNYLCSTDKAELNPEAIAQDFKTLLEDPDTDLDHVEEHLGQFDRSTLKQILSQREEINSEEVAQILNQLESTRDQVLSEAKELQNHIQARAEELHHKVSDYLRNTDKEEFRPKDIHDNLKILFHDADVTLNAFRVRLSPFDRGTLMEILSQRQDLNEQQVNQVLDQMESARVKVANKLANRPKEKHEKTTQILSQYLRNANLEKLNPEGIQQDLSTLLSDPKAGASALQERLSHVDRETLVKLLSQREDLSEEQVNQAIDQIQSAIRNVVKAPRRLANRVQKEAVDFKTNLEEYLQNTDKEELNPDGIKRDLQLLLQHPRAGLSSLGDRTSEFDRETFVALLAQREDLSEEEANQIADQVESNFKAIIEQVQQVQQAIQSKIDKGFDSVRSYLNGLELPELNYEGIKQDFGKLFNDPQMGLEALRDRLTQFDRETLVAVLSSRDDISEADVHRVIDQVESSRDNVLHKIEKIQQETQKRLDSVKQEAQKQVRETRKMAAGAAWWVFSSALSSLAASAIAGYLAVTRFAIL
nr:hypothetical protein A5482_08160 [Cyanobacterium sp. IPPAS B-1200]